MDKFNGADIHAASRLRYEQELRRQSEFAADDQFLLITAGQRSRRQSSVWRAHVKVADYLCRALLNSLFVQEHPGKGNRRLAIMNAENRVFSQTEIQKQSATVS